MRKLILLLAVFELAGSLYGADNPFIGTWKLNLAKSKFSGVAPKEWTDVYREVEGDKLEVTAKIIMADGSSLNEKLVYPQQGGAATFLQGGGQGIYEVETLIAPSEWLGTRMKDGKQIGCMRIFVSKDRKTMHYILKITDIPLEGEAVFDRQ